VPHDRALSDAAADDLSVPTFLPTPPSADLVSAYASTKSTDHVISIESLIDWAVGHLLT
jgi:hypothetical protein